MVLNFKIDTADYDSEENVLDTLNCIIRLLDCACPDSCELVSNLRRQMNEQVEQDASKNAKMFYEALKTNHLDQYKDDEHVEDLFKYWMSADYAYFNSVLLDLMRDTERFEWTKLKEWCDKTSPVFGHDLVQEVKAWKSIISN